MRVLLVTPHYPPRAGNGGVPVVVRALARGLAAAGHAVAILTDDTGGARPDDLPDVDVVVLPPAVRVRAGAISPGAARFAAGHLGAFDVVHLFGTYHALGAAMAGHCVRRGIPYVIEPSGMLPPSGRSRMAKRIFLRLRGRRALAAAAAVVATGPGERDALAAMGVGADRLHVRRLGVEPDPSPAGVQPGRFRARLGVPDGALLVLYMGRLATIKGPDLLVGAFAGVHGHAHLALAGPHEDARLVRRLRDQVAAAGLGSRVHMTGAVHGVTRAEALADADVFVLPSRSDCFGLAAAEAVAAGIPVLVSAAAGVARYVEGRAGLVAEPTVAGLQAGLERLLGDDALRQRLRDGCAAVAAGLTWDAPVAEMVALYETIAATARADGAQSAGLGA
ncbi:MAG TPA: glycosyltransferase [Longimicrobiales bacterium]|nr:glycosyltransferase [Longimicrobiales bacterium]